MSALTRAWVMLLALSAASTVLSIAVTQGTLGAVLPTAIGAAVLILAWAKARIILGAYLRLREAPAIQRGFALSLGLYALLLLGLYVAG